MAEGRFGWCVALSLLPFVGPFSSVLRIPWHEHTLEYIPTSTHVLAIPICRTLCFGFDSFPVAV